MKIACNTVPFRAALSMAVISASFGCGGDDDAPPIDAGSDSARAALDASSSGTDAGLDVDAGVAASDAGTTSGFVRTPVLVPTGPLCTPDLAGIAAGTSDPAFIPCEVESDRFSDRAPTDPASELRVVAWNVEFGNESATVQSQLLTNPELSTADVLLLSEVSRHSHTSTPDGVNQARELAMALSMDYVIGVEWDRRLVPAEDGEHCVAILSKWPIGNVSQVRHTPGNDWYDEDMLLGGRISLGADLLVGTTLVRVYASHFETRPLTGSPSNRVLSGNEVRADADLSTSPVQLIGGDLNTWTCNPTIGDCTVPPRAEQTVSDFLAAGWSDGNAGFRGSTQLGSGFFPQRLDWIFYRGATATPGVAVTSAMGSDHLPIWTVLHLP